MALPLRQAGLALLMSVNAACSPDTPVSRPNDIFTQDQGDAATGNARRHPATNDDKLWAIRIPAIDALGNKVANRGRCTGHLVSPDIVMTAGHCQMQLNEQLTSGSALNNSQADDMTVTQILEHAGDNGVDVALDYTLMKVQWAAGSAPADMRWAPLIATQKTDVQTNATLGQGDTLFAVGYPVDKQKDWGTTYSEGQAKNADDGTKRLYYDTGIINGNSGGGIWRKSDNMLMSLANNGVHSINPNDQTDTRWRSGSADDPTEWNFGPSMWLIYAQSATLKDLFPNGRNRFALAATGGAPGVWMAIGTADGATPDAYTLYASVPAAATKVIWCATATADQCNAQAAGYTGSASVKTIDQQAIFQGQSATALTDGMSLTIVATDAQGNQVGTRTLTVRKK